MRRDTDARRTLSFLLLLAGAALSCAPAPTPAPLAAPAPAADGAPAVELVESAPEETSLDHADVPNAADVWLAMIQKAERRLDIAQFYVSNAPNSRLEPILQAIEAAADRGVAVRLLVEQSFYARYPDSADRLASRRGIAVRRFDASASMGGILHAKYFVVDDREAFAGSQNFDWRSLSHIQEIGVRIRQADVVRALGALFDADWEIAGGADAAAAFPARSQAPGDRAIFPVRVTQGGAPIEIQPVASPRGFVPAPWEWDLPRIVAAIDGARRSVHVQVLTYKTTSRDGSAFPDLDEALRRAGARGVEVRMLLSDWAKRSGSVEAVQRLERAPGVDVKFVTIPRWSGGFIPFARVVHAKYMVVDGSSAWIGTSNWEGDYFTKSRNVGLFVQGAPIAGRLDRIFQEGWDGPNAAAVDPDATYTAPRIDRE